VLGLPAQTQPSSISQAGSQPSPASPSPSSHSSIPATSPSPHAVVQTLAASTISKPTGWL
jgi:hypothetical protein